MKIFFAGGGTGGHLFPALAMAEELKKVDKSIEISFIGSRNRIEERLIPKQGYPIHFLWISGFSRGSQLRNLLFPLKLTISLIQSFFLIFHHRPDIVIGTGGFVSGPFVFMAHLMKIPTVIQEQNSYPGITNRILARIVDQVHLTYEVSEKYIRSKGVVYISGNPVRKVLGEYDREKAKKQLKLVYDRKTVFIFGGSQGAASINRMLSSVVEKLIHDLEVQIIWQTGEKDYTMYNKKFGDDIYIHIKPFIENIEAVYAVADLVVCRAGATTIAELTLCGLPSILIPYPYAASNHQEYNAATMVEKGAAKVLLEREITSEKLYNLIAVTLRDEQDLKEMKISALKLAKPDASGFIVERALELV